MQAVPLEPGLDLPDVAANRRPRYAEPAFEGFRRDRRRCGAEQGEEDPVLAILGCENRRAKARVQGLANPITRLERSLGPDTDPRPSNETQPVRGHERADRRQVVADDAVGQSEL